MIDGLAMKSAKALIHLSTFESTLAGDWCGDAEVFVHHTRQLKGCLSGCRKITWSGSNAYSRSRGVYLASIVG